jgi:hypothetical protein
MSGTLSFSSSWWLMVFSLKGFSAPWILDCYAGLTHELCQGLVNGRIQGKPLVLVLAAVNPWPLKAHAQGLCMCTPQSDGAACRLA